mgnify:CR=1 FL=1
MATIKDLKRMCKSFETSCNGCPFQNKIDDDCLMTMLTFDCFPDNADEIIDKWVLEHPIKTYMQDFFEKFPSAPKKESGCPKICLLNIYGGKKPCVFGHHDCYKCWNSEMEKV